MQKENQDGKNMMMRKIIERGPENLENIGTAMLVARIELLK